MSRIKHLAVEMAKIHADAFRNFWDAVDESSSILRQIDPIRRKPWMAELIQEILQNQDGKCAICYNPVDFGNHHVDHKIPFTWGGGNERTNLQVAHPICNQRRGDTVSAHDLISYIEDRAINF